MSAQNAMEVIRLATVNPSFRSAFNADPSQALTLFAADLGFSGAGALTQDEIDGIKSITDAEYDAFARMTSAVGVDLNPGTARSAGSLLMF